MAHTTPSSVTVSAVVDDFDVGIAGAPSPQCWRSALTSKHRRRSIENFLPTLSVALACRTSRHAARSNTEKMNIALIARRPGSSRAHFASSRGRNPRPSARRVGRVEFSIILPFVLSSLSLFPSSPHALALADWFRIGNLELTSPGSSKIFLLRRVGILLDRIFRIRNIENFPRASIFRCCAYSFQNFQLNGNSMPSGDALFCLNDIKSI